MRPWPTAQPATPSPASPYTGAAGTLARGPSGHPRLIVTPNLDHWRLLHRSRAFRAANHAASVVLNDSRFLRHALWNSATPCDNCA